MKANVIHVDLNPCGGAEQLALATLQSLLDMEMEVDLTVAKAPDIARIEKAFGSRVRGIFSRIKVKPLGKLPIEPDPQTGTLTCRKGAEGAMQEYDMIVNTHGDILPYFLPHFSSKNCITYCHFPVVAGYSEQRNLDYLHALSDMGLIDESIAKAATQSTLFWRSFLEYYLLMLRNSLVITNSKFSRQAIITVMKSGAYRMTNEPTIIVPPVCVEELRHNASFLSAPDHDYVLVVSRIHPSKKLENAIQLARILKQKEIGNKMIIAGNLLADDSTGQRYYLQLLDMVESYGVSDYVTLKPNVELGKLWSLMRQSKAYFHPMPEEPFGISVVEAMAAGLVPVVPNVGGPTEFVPRKYQFSTLEEAAGMIRMALHASNEERAQISDSVKGFSTSAYIKQFQQFIQERLATTATPYERGPTWRPNASRRTGLA
jgi:alpha-1,2-mannosyltransferase